MYCEDAALMWMSSVVTMLAMTVQVHTPISSDRIVTQQSRVFCGSCFPYPDKPNALVC